MLKSAIRDNNPILFVESQIMYNFKGPVPEGEHLVPLDMETILASVRKTGRCVVASHCVGIGSYTGEIASRIMAEAFDSLDAPVLRIGAKDGIAPQAYSLEDAFLPHDRDIVAAVKQLL